MADPRFYAVAGPFSLEELATIAKAKVSGRTDPTHRFVDVAPLDDAGPDHVSFLDNRLYKDEFAASQAGACLVSPALADRAPAGMALLVTPEPYRAFARVAQAFYPSPPAASSIAPRATVDASARLGEGVRVEAGAVIGPKVEIGRGSIIGPNAVIGAGVTIGEECWIGSGTTLAYCVIGARAIIHPGVRIGHDGFGFALGAPSHLKVPQVGRVVIEDDVEIGANTTIDRGSMADTRIGAGTKIDNLVQIAHNVQIGRGCIIVAQVGISGSTRIGDFVMMGGQSGVAGHLDIGRGARVGAQAGIMRDVPAGTTVIGSPAVPVKEFWRQVATLTNISRRSGS
ncbi:MAG: UDP-3-O-(3-hydroxymyristoyl)glucosamine N-acyltransferase [Rhodospirillales bacterium]|nr:UDP-3-O-(3-hydroxymyristoyl)glucosamine N-acyltransferase [Rhodospirillales bacterium]